MAIDGTDLLRTRRELELALGDALARGAADLAALKLSARLGAVAAEIGNRHEARRQFALVANAGPAVLGPDHPLVRQAETYLSNRPRATVSPAAEGTPDARAAESPRGSKSRESAPAAIDPTGREIERGPSRSLAPLRDRPPATSRGSRRKSLVWAVASSAAIAAVIAASAALWHREGAQSTSTPNAAKSSAAPVVAPQHVTATMDHGVVTVKWQDPARGTTPFIVSGGVAGATADVRQQVDAGQSTVAINGLNNSRDYCFTVVAVYSADQVAVSDLACTKH